MVYDIVFEPNEILHRRSADLTPEQINTPKIQKFIKDMIETMYAKDGVGLAAVQVGESMQLCVIAKNFNDLNPNQDLCLINPTWTKATRHTNWDEEGCLSVPGIYGKVKRYTNLKVKALDSKGRPLEFNASDFFARIIQHESDHLNGILFIEKAKDLHRFEKNPSRI